MSVRQSRVLSILSQPKTIDASITPMYLNQVIVTREEEHTERIRRNLNGLILF